MASRIRNRGANTFLKNDDNAAGFSGDDHKQDKGNQEQFRYDLDTFRLKWYVSLLSNASKRICTYQPKINTKTRKEKEMRNYRSKRLGNLQETYQQALKDAEDASKHISDTLLHVEEKPLFSRSQSTENLRKPSPYHAQTTSTSEDLLWEGEMWRKKLRAAEAERHKYIGLLNSFQEQSEELARLKGRLQKLKSKNARLLQNYRQEKAGKDDALIRLHAVASSKIHDNNPNIGYLSDVNRPTRIAEKMSELYDNEWTDAFDLLEKSHTEMDVVWKLVNILKNINEQCHEMAWQDFFPRVQSAIELPAKVLQEFKQHVSTRPYYEIVLTKEMQQQIKEFRKLRAPSCLPIIQRVLVPKDVDSDELRDYYNKCVEVCWLAAVQDPPLFMNFIPGEKFDTTLFKDYTARGPYVEFLVLPALQLHQDGPIVSKGIAQGTWQSRGVQGYTTQDSVGGRRPKDRPASVVVASSTIRDNNPNIADLSDVNRPTKIAEKMSELYDNEWTDAFDSLEKTHSDLNVVWKLVDILKNINDQCHAMAWQDFFPRVQSAIELPAKVLQELKPSTRPEYEIVLTKEMQQQIKEFRKLRAPTILPIVQKALLSKDVDSKELITYTNKCVEVCWLAAVQDPPLFMNFNPGEKFDTTLFKDYTTRGPYVEFLVWPALHLHANGPLLSKGVAQGARSGIRRTGSQERGSTKKLKQQPSENTHSATEGASLQKFTSNSATISPPHLSDV